jgi:hypothetical protein
MTKEQLRHLALLPKVIAALKAQADELEQLRAQMQRVGMSMPASPPVHTVTVLPQPPPPAPAASAVLMTPERLEYESQLKAKRAAAGIPPPQAPKPVDQLPAAQRRAVEKGYMASIQGERQTKMAQFTYDGTDDIHEGQVVATEPLRTLSEAT